MAEPAGTIPPTDDGGEDRGSGDGAHPFARPEQDPSRDEHDSGPRRRDALAAQVAAERERELAREGEVVHVYDDIRECDHSLPRWWLYALIATMVFEPFIPARCWIAPEIATAM